MGGVVNDIRAARRTSTWAQSVHGRPTRSRRRWRARWIGGALLAGMLWLLYAAVSEYYRRGPLAVVVKRADLIVSVRGNGVVESADNLDVPNPVPGRRNILQIVPDGSYVRKGDLIVRLDGGPLEETLAAERAAVSKAEAAVVRAKRTWQAARIAVDEYDKGIYVRQRHELTRHILTAEQRLASVEHSLLKIQIMFRKGWVSPPHVEAMETAVETEQAGLEAAKHKRDILDELTRVKVIAELAGKRDAAAARLESAEAIVRTKNTKIARLLDDVKRCEIHAPRDGMVVYGPDIGAANQPLSPAERGTIYPGATVRQSQTLVRLADVGQMQAKLLVSRGKLSELRKGQRARVKVLGQELRGGVVSIADRPETVASPGGNIRQYAVAVALEAPGERFKPGMSAEVEIVVEHRENTLVIPALCVADERGEPYVKVKKRSGAATREVKLGLANDSLVEVLAGVDEGEWVLLSPEGTE